MQYDAIIFDLFGTLVDNFPPKAFAHLLTELAHILRVPPQDFIHLWNVDLWPRRSQGDFATLEATFTYACNLLGVQPTEDQIQLAVQKRFAYTQRTLVPRHDSVETLTQLKAMGYKLGLISDCTMEVPQSWSNTPLAGLIDVPIFSCEVKHKKPDPQIYKLAYEQLGVEPQRCLYIGDGGSRELTGALAVGMHAILIRAPYEQESQSSEHRHEVAAWTGPRIVAIKDVLNFVV